MSQPLVKVENLTIEYNSYGKAFKAVDDVSMDIYENEKIALVGESGSGKTTLAMSILRMLKPPGLITSGKILHKNSNLIDLSEEEIRSRRLSEFSLITQASMNSLNPVLRIKEQLLDGLLDHGKLNKDENNSKIRSVLDQVQLPHSVLNMYPHELSGGMKQRVSIACAILLNPDFIVADEPTSALDVIIQRQVISTLFSIQKKYRTSILLIGHDLGLVIQFADRIAVMHNGKIVELKKTEELLDSASHWYTKTLLESVPSFSEESKAINRSNNLKKASEFSLDKKITIQLKNVFKSYESSLLGARHNFALKNINFEFNNLEPSIIGIAGQSGSGKSTLMQILLGTLTQTSGEVLLNEKPLLQYVKRNRKKYLLQVQPIFQDPYGVYNPFYKAIHFLQETAVNLNLISHPEYLEGFIEEILLDVGLNFHDLKERYPHELSGGQRQRLMVARALMVKPQIILADEPVSMIDASLRASILENILTLKNQYGITVIYITHDLTTAFQICDTLNVMYQGEIVESGLCKEVILQPKHSYTKSLIASIPSKNKTSDWMQLSL